MVNPWTLPESVLVNGREYPIRTDFRVVLDLLTALSDPEMQGEDDEETAMIRASLISEIMFPEYKDIPASDFEAALNAVIEFIDIGMSDDENNDKKSPRLMDWEQDAPLIIPAVNRVMGRDVRSESKLHWWTFLSLYMEIGECSFSHILSIRQKRAKGKKLEKWEQEYLNENKNIVLLRQKLTDEERAEREVERKALDDLFG